MVKKIGKLFFLVFIFFVNAFVSAQTDILKISITDMHGQSVQELTRGVSYMLEIKAEGNYDLHKVVIPGLNALHHEFRGATRFNMMSKVSTQHSYVLRADAVGTYILGPAQLVSEKGVVIHSNTLSFSVVQEKQSDVIVELLTNVDRAVVGEKITVRVRLNTHVPTELLSIEQPKLDQSIGTLSELKQVDRGTVAIDTVLYEYAEWHAQLVVNKMGTLIIPAFKALCKLLNKQERPQDVFSGMLHRFGGGPKPQQYFSNDLSLSIEPLPYHRGAVDAIGIFSKFTATLNQENAQVGEGIVVTLTLEGKTDLDAIQAPALSIQDGLKYYESKMINQNGVNHYKKSFEYIIQGMKPGSYEIPEQNFTFFNTETRAFETLRTNHLSITIMPNQTIANKPLNKENDEVASDFDEDDIFPLQVRGPWLFKKERSLSWFWFFVFSLLPLLYFCYHFIGMYVYEYKIIHALYLKKKYAFMQARKQLEKSKKNLVKPAHVYDIFLNLFAARLQVPLSELNADVIEKRLTHVGFSTDEVNQWHRFFYMLEEAAFMPNNQKNNDDQLIKRAEIWLKQLEEKL